MGLNLMGVFCGGYQLAAEVKECCNELLETIKDVGQQYRERQDDCNTLSEMMQTIRRPLFDADGNLEGTEGSAMDLSIRGDDIFERIEMWSGGQNSKKNRERTLSVE